MKWIVRASSSETNPRPPRKPSRRSGRRDSLRASLTTFAAVLVPDDSLRSSSDVRLTSFSSPSSGHRRPPLALSVHQGQPAGKPVSWRTERARPGPGSTAFAAPCAASPGELCSPGDASREGPQVPRPARAAAPREDTAANAVSKARSEPRDWSRPRAFEIVAGRSTPDSAESPVSRARVSPSQFTGVQMKSIPCE